MGEPYRLMAVFIDAPWLAALPGGLFLWAWRRTRRRLVLVAALAWLFYVPYEYGMKWRVLCSGECNIRVDLLALYPALLVLSLLAMISAALALRALDHRRPASPPARGSMGRPVPGTGTGHGPVNRRSVNAAR